MSAEAVVGHTWIDDALHEGILMDVRGTSRVILDHESVGLGDVTGRPEHGEVDHDGRMSFEVPENLRHGPPCGGEEKLIDVEERQPSNFFERCQPLTPPAFCL